MGDLDYEAELLLLLLETKMIKLLLLFLKNAPADS